MAGYKDVPEGALDFLTEKRGGAAAPKGHPDRIAFDAMNGGNTSRPDMMFGLDERMEEAGLTSKKFKDLYLESHSYGGESGREADEWLGGQESYGQMKSYYDPETYRNEWAQFKDPKMMTSRMSKAKDYMTEMRTSVEKDRFAKNYGDVDATTKEWGMPSEVFEKKRGYEDWMRDEGLFDPEKTKGVKGFLQRVVPGGKKGYTRERIDPASERAAFSGEGEFLKKGSY